MLRSSKKFNWIVVYWAFTKNNGENNLFCKLKLLFTTKVKWIRCAAQKMECHLHLSYEITWPWSSNRIIYDFGPKSFSPLHPSSHNKPFLVPARGKESHQERRRDRISMNIEMYRAEKKSLYMVWWNLFLLLLITSATTCLKHSHNHRQRLFLSSVCNLLVLARFTGLG